VTECFCGCGRRVPRFPLGTRAINKRGRLIEQRLAWARDVMPNLGDAAAWAEHGDEILAGLSRTVHGEFNPRLLDEAESREWMAYGRSIEAVAVRAGHPPIKKWLAHHDRKL
jgi:hypothetical protein